MLWLVFFSRTLLAATQPAPPGVKLTVAFDRPEYLLGENVLLQFVLENRSNKTFTANFGGDYRGIDRSLRFKITAVDADGKVTADPDPDPMYFGGISSDREVLAGGKAIISLPLLRYCRIDHPGRYTVRATHDFGWRGKVPIAETTVTFRQPTAAEAEEVVEKMEKLRDDDQNSDFGIKSPDYADFRCLRYPVYFAPLRTRAMRGDLRALEGLSGVPSREATASLIELAGGNDGKVSAAAAAAVNDRLPIPAIEGRPTSRWVYSRAKWNQRRELSALAWDDTFAGKALALAHHLLRSETPALVAEGAHLIFSLGTPADASLVLEALDRALISSGSRQRNPAANALDFPVPIPELLGAMRALDERGYGNHEGIEGNAGTLAYFQYWNRKDPARPADFAKEIEDFGVGSWFPIRQLALEAIPQPMPGEYVKSVRRGLADQDYSVCRIACSVAAKSGRREFLKPILEIVAIENEPWLLREASNAAQTLGGEVALWSAWADRLGEPELTDIGLDSLQTILTGLPGSSGGRTDLTRGERLAMRDAWRRFLGAHAKDIEAGKRFKIGDREVPPALFGRARAWKLADGTEWPLSSQAQSIAPTEEAP